LISPKLLVAAWATSAIGGFWYFEGRYLVPKPSYKITARKIENKAKRPMVRIFWAHDCLCSRFAVPHLDDLYRQFSKEFDFVVEVQAPGGTQSEAEKGWLETGLKIPYHLDLGSESAKEWGIGSSPSVVITDGKGELRYRGVVNAARACDNEETAFAKKALLAIRSGVKVEVETTPFYGCAVTH
jgi:hypothetical protein